MGIFPPCCTEVLEKMLEMVCGKQHDVPRESDSSNQTSSIKIKGTVVLRKKNVLNFKDAGSAFLDRMHELFGKRVILQLISADPGNGSKGKVGKPAILDWTSSKTWISVEEVTFNITFEWDESIGVPGAFIIKNYHHSQFYLKTVALEDIPSHGKVHFVCNSWVYPAHRYKYDRVFFSNKTYLPCNTPEPLRPYRNEELVNLQGTGSGKLKEWDRVYDYAVYNDLGHGRPVLGGGKDYPYPRRGRTGRPLTKRDSSLESRLPLLSLNIYVPRDERFNHVKFVDFLGYGAKSMGRVIIPQIATLLAKPFNEFKSFKHVLKVYKGRVPDNSTECMPWEFLKGQLHKFPIPHVIKDNNSAWRTDEEFGREMLAGVNPVIIQRLQEFPPTSKLDPEVYGDQTSKITRDQIEKYMDGLTVDDAIKYNRLFILDYHDGLMPYLKRINSTTNKIYASRTLLLLQDDGTLKPLAIELSLPHPQGDKHGSSSQVFTPCNDESAEGYVWHLAKAYVAVNDSGYHQLVSHWLNTHAALEPFIIAANRQLSVLHPIYKLLHPHFRDTMNINALARQILISAGGILELTVFPSKYAMEMSSSIYKNWVFTEQALPADLLKRGVAVPDPSQPYGLRLLIEDYPYAVDGLEIWSAIETWVDEYCSFYYLADDMIQGDSELQSWWTEVRNVGHGDLKDEPWWPQMQTRDELVQICTIIIWVASALHAAVNFGQYPYAGYLPNRPTVSRRFMPMPGTPEYVELESNHERAYLKTITAQFQTLLGISLIEMLSMHSSDEIYLGQRDAPEWTSDSKPRHAFEGFHDKLVEIENRIMDRNNDNTLKNRKGPIQMPYTLLYPNASGDKSTTGLTGKGIPNSISI